MNSTYRNGTHPKPFLVIGYKRETGRKVSYDVWSDKRKGGKVRVALAILELCSQISIPHCRGTTTLE